MRNALLTAALALATAPPVVAQSANRLHCERTVAKALQSVPGVTEVLEVSHKKGEARIVAGEQASRDGIEGAVQRAGYRAQVREDAGPTV